MLNFELRTSQRLLLDLIRNYGPVTRAELSRMSNLTAGAITQYCRELMHLGLIIEGERILGQRGQPSLPLSLNPIGGCALGISFSPNQLDLSIVDLAGNKIITVSESHQENQPIEYTLKKIRIIVHNTLKKRQLLHSRILGIGYAVPGYLKKDGRKRYCVSWLSSWRDHDLTELFTQNLNYPTWVENNANAAAIGEYYSKDWDKIKDMAVIDLGYGIGGGAILNGHLVYGGFLNAGEVGMAFPLGTPRPSLKNLIQYLVDNGLEASKVSEYVESGHPLVEKWLMARLPQVEQVVLGSLQWLDPKLIILGGTLPIQLIDRMTMHLNEKFSHSFEIEKPVAKIVTSKQGSKSASLGAAKIPIYHTLNSINQFK
ncbi:ROK family protein [Thorsellia kenyensis]|uniref:ROK family protein n=1 Tax=Thorsellia kenyensis TaxID=1549888 RepID=A0ABV6C845_9GAMM